MTRGPLIPGVLIEDEPEPSPRPRRWGVTAAIWTLRGALVAGGVAIMHAEGLRQPTPGVGFAVALAMFMAAALVGSRSKC